MKVKRLKRGVFGPPQYSPPLPLIDDILIRKLSSDKTMCTIIVLCQDYAHPNCMLHNRYRWDGLSFENRCFVSFRNYAIQVFTSKLSLSFCVGGLPALKIHYKNGNACIGKVGIYYNYKEKYTSHYQSLLQQRRLGNNIIIGISELTSLMLDLNEPERSWFGQLR